MKLIDANLLLYAYDSSAEHHEVCKQWIEEMMSGREQVRLAWATILAFLRITTAKNILKRPLSILEALGFVSDWLAQPAVDVIDPGERHLSILSSLLKSAQARGPLVTNAHLAALAIEHGAVVCTNDKDFSRFSGLRVFNPIEETN